MLDSTLAHTVANDPTLRLRIEALFRQRLAVHAVTPIERQLFAGQVGILVDAIAWQVAGNPTIFGAIKTHHEAHADDPVEAAIEAGATDGDLTYVLHSQITCLAD